MESLGKIFGEDYAQSIKSALDAFFRIPTIQDKLESNDFLKIYNSFSHISPSTPLSALTYLFMKSGIDPLPYLNDTFPYMFFELGLEEIDLSSMGNNGEAETFINDGTFISCGKVKKLILPKLFQYQSANTFLDLTGLEDVYFSGTSFEWIDICDPDKIAFRKGCTIHCSNDDTIYY